MSIEVHKWRVSDGSFAIALRFLNPTTKSVGLIPLTPTILHRNMKKGLRNCDRYFKETSSEVWETSIIQNLSLAYPYELWLTKSLSMDVRFPIRTPSNPPNISLFDLFSRESTVGPKLLYPLLTFYAVWVQTNKGIMWSRPLNIGWCLLMNASMPEITIKNST